MYKLIRETCIEGPKPTNLVRFCSEKWWVVVLKVYYLLINCSSYYWVVTIHLDEFTSLQKFSLIFYCIINSFIHANSSLTILSEFWIWLLYWKYIDLNQNVHHIHRVYAQSRTEVWIILCTITYILNYKIFFVKFSVNFIPHATITGIAV